jgi:hypothetical protein
MRSGVTFMAGFKIFARSGITTGLDAEQNERAALAQRVDLGNIRRGTGERRKVGGIGSLGKFFGDLGPAPAPAPALEPHPKSLFPPVTTDIL